MIPYDGQWILLQGINSVLPEKLLLHVCQVTDHSVDSIEEANPEQPPATAVYPPEIQALLDCYPPVLDPPAELPLFRLCNHTIPLIPGVQPVFIPPYQYPPALKD